MAELTDEQRHRKMDMTFQIIEQTSSAVRDGVPLEAVIDALRNLARTIEVERLNGRAYEAAEVAMRRAALRIVKDNTEDGE